MTPSSTVPNIATRSAASVGPYWTTAASHPSATTSSTRGYTAEMRSPQPRQRARSASQLTSGTFSYHGISCPQPGQRERGEMTDSSFGQRDTHTLRKEPSAAPRRKAIRRGAAMPAGSGDTVSAESDGGGSRRQRPH